MSRKTATRFLLLICIAGFSISIVINYPGFMSNDSVVQLLEGQDGLCTDWHPLHGVRLAFRRSNDPGFAWNARLQTALIWSGTFLVTRYWFLELQPALLGLFAAGIVFYPPIFTITGAVWKDIFMLGFLMNAIGIAGGPMLLATKGPMASLCRRYAGRSFALDGNVVPEQLPVRRGLPNGFGHRRCVARCIVLFVNRTTGTETPL